MYPAYQDFSRDIEVGFARWRVYMYLQPPRLTHHTPDDVKVSEIVLARRMSPRDVIGALDWLTAHGYLVEHSRGARGVRRLTLVYARKVAAPDFLNEKQSLSA